MVTFKRLSRECRLQFDLIVVGAGSAGWLLASRLSRHFSVALIEAGGATSRNPQLRRPADYLKRFESDDDWGYRTVPQAQLAGRRLLFPRGRGVGGSTRINASIWLPPEADCLHALAAQSGGHFTSEMLDNALAAVTEIIAPESPRWLSPASQLAVQAAGPLGIALAPFLRMNRRGRRSLVSDFDYAGRAAEDRAEPSVGWTCFSDGYVERLLFSNGVADGVRVCDQDNDQHCYALNAARGVVLACGAIGTPLLLQRSGIGPADVLADAEIDCRRELPEVGRNLADHLVVPVVADWIGSGLDGSAQRAAPFPAAWSPRELATFNGVGGGPATCNLAEAGGFIGSGAEQVQLFVTPTDYLRHPQPAPAAITIGVVPSRPASRGSVRLPACGSEESGPQIDPAYLCEPSDGAQVIAGVEQARQLLGTQPLAAAVKGERSPGTRRTQPAAILKSVARFAQTLYHPVGTCRLGSDPQAVVEPNFAVRTCQHLWIADASVIANPPAANPNPLVMALAYLAADEIAVQLLANTG